MCSNKIVRLLWVGIVCCASLPTAGSQSQWGHYPINKDDFHDYFGNNRDGIALDGAVTVFDSHRGWVADFTQNAQGSPRIQLGTDDPAASGELTISTWVRWFGLDGRWQGIAGKSLSPTNRGWILQLRDTNGEIYWPNGPTGVILDQDRWLHLVVTFGQGTSRVYVDGHERYEISGVSLPHSGNWPSAHVTVGHAEDRSDASQWFNGYLDDVSFFSKALSSGEVMDFFNGTAPSFLKARNPSPANGATGVAASLLSWTAGDTAFLHKVYVGTSCSLGSANLMGSYPKELTLFFYVPGLQPGGTYCWRVDEVEQNGTVHTGDVWCFTAGPATAPRGGILNPCCNPVLTWPPVAGAVAYHVYFGDGASAIAPGSPAGDKGTTSQTTFPLGKLQGGTTYYWRIDAITAQGVILPGVVWSFTVPMCNAGGVLREWWLNIPGTSVSDLRKDPRYPASPDGRECLNCFEGPIDWADNYGTRLSAWLLPPASGEYTFWIAGDDNQELYLSTDDKPVNAKLIATVASWTAPQEWAKEAGQKSKAIALKTGQKYYIEAVGKEGGGGDSIAVAWQGPGMAAPQVICTPFVENPACTSFIAYSPHPADGEADVAPATILSWQAGQAALQHDVYFGDDYDAVANAGPVRCGPYAGRQNQTTYDPGLLAPGKTYYWRIDEINSGNPASPWPGCVWSFTTSECGTVIDNFESYSGSNPISLKWTGTPHPVAVERTIVHGGLQSMRMDYDNRIPPFCSEAQPAASLVTNWTLSGATTLSLWFHGAPPKFMQTSPNSYIMSASGTDIWGTADEFRYAYKRLAGDGTITARVQHVGNTNSWAKAGVMIRETLDPGSTHAMVVVTPGNGVSFQRRRITGGASEDTTQPGIQAPYWVKLTRQGSTFKAQHSPDGTTWTDFATGPSSVPITMSASVYIGMALTGHNPDSVTEAQFSHVSTTGNVTGPWQVADIGVTQPGNDPCPLYVRVQDTAGKIAVVRHPDNPYAVLIDEWRQWSIPFSAFTGVNLTHLKEMAIGVGDGSNPSADGAGRIYIDDICLR